jgi:DNA-binding NarL/FixJ family response regulator
MTLVNLPVTIGIVDDHKLFRQGIRQILNRFDDYHLLFEAASCQELLEVLSQQQPNVLLMDLQMPDMDGLEGCKRVLEQYPTIKIIVISMHTADSFVFHTLKMGARSYLPKDIDQQTLRAAIDEVMTKGYYFTDQVAKAMLRGFQTTPKGKPSFQAAIVQLTQREKEVLSLICQGHTTNVMAEQLFISARTVEGHRKNLLEKTGTHNSVSLAVYAIKHNLLGDHGTRLSFE